MTDPSVNIFEALRRMGAKIPFRFPMIENLVPVVTMYDVSKLVSAPIEPRGVTGHQEALTGAPTHLIGLLHCLGTGGLLLDQVVLRNTEPVPWTVSVSTVPGIALPTARTVEDVGGTPVASEFFSDQDIFQAALGTGAMLPDNVDFIAEPRWYLAPGSWLRIMSGSRSGADTMSIALAWHELPASFEEP